MRFVRLLYHFLGGIRFAVIIIALATVAVVAGTFVESLSGSHRLASTYTYGNPLFQGLLGLFFVNILFASLRRWPFQGRHIPFLITHLGLLMVIAGTLIKSIYGLQGTMGLMEGSGGHTVFIPGTLAIRATERASGTSYDYPIRRNWRQFKPTIAGGPIDIELLAYYPHGHERWLTWIKDHHAQIAGLPPFPVIDLSKHTGKITPGAHARIEGDGERLWHFFAVAASDHFSGLQAIYLQETNAELVEALGSPDGGLESVMAITADAAYEVLWTGKHRGAVNATPSVVLTQTPDEGVVLWAFDERGHIYCQPFLKDTVETLAVFDKGFSGYGAYVKLPFTTQPELECVLARAITPLDPLQKLEDNVPVVYVRVSDDKGCQTLALTYDQYAQGLSWPALEGRWKLRFQPHCLDIPHHLRLRNARQINYLLSAQAYSYEADFIVSDNLHFPREVSLSMNNVYETRDGYRFYLANISPGTEGAVQRVQLAVNHDPAKYWLTYPGGVILAIGIVLLFWVQPYQQQRARNIRKRNRQHRT